LQFENIINKNYSSLLKILNIPIEEVDQIGPYTQQKNSKQEGCQFDLIIQNKFKVLYLCEFKAKKQIDLEVTKEFVTKTKKLKINKGFSFRKVLVYAGELSSSVEESGVFDYIVSFSDLLS
jgi:hypothetical protein